MSVDIAEDTIKNYLLCAEYADRIIRVRKSQTYFCANPNVKEAISYGFKKDRYLDKERWRANIIEYWKSNDAERFGSIQACLRSAK